MQNTPSSSVKISGHAALVPVHVIGHADPASVKVFGRTELALQYFPHLKPHSAWLKLRSLLTDDPSTVRLAQQSRRTFMPAEVDLIYHSLGRP
jgi:hypothetical protein